MNIQPLIMLIADVRRDSYGQSLGADLHQETYAVKMRRRYAKYIEDVERRAR